MVEYARFLVAVADVGCAGHFFLRRPSSPRAARPSNGDGLLDPAWRQEISRLMLVSRVLVEEPCLSGIGVTFLLRERIAFD